MDVLPLSHRDTVWKLKARNRGELESDYRQVVLIGSAEDETEPASSLESRSDNQTRKFQSYSD